MNWARLGVRTPIDMVTLIKEAQHLLLMLQASWAEQQVSLFVGHGLTRSVGVA